MLRPALTAAMLAVVMPATLHTTDPQRPSPVAPAVRPTAPGPAKTRPAVPDRVTKREGATAARPALSPVQMLLQQNAALAGMVTGRLPVGADLMTVSAGFRELREFVATVNASNALGIPFIQLKRRIVDGMSLGLAIQDVRPRSQYWLDAQRAEEEASRLIRASEAAAPAVDRPETSKTGARPVRPSGARPTTVS